MYSLTPKLTPRELSYRNTSPRAEMITLPYASEYDPVPQAGNMAITVTKHKHSNNMFGKILSINKSNKPGNDQAVEFHNSSWPEFQPLSSPMKDAKINPVIRPEGQKLVARMEPRLTKGAKKPITPPAAPLMRPSRTLVRASTEPASVDRPKTRHGETHHSRHRQVDGVSCGNSSQSRSSESVRSSNSTGSRGIVLNVHKTPRLFFTAENQIRVIAEDWAAGNEEAYSWWCWYLKSYSKVSSSYDRGSYSVVSNWLQGQFNLTQVPPIRYALKPGNYFPALFPAWERDMLSESQKLEVIWSQWTEERRLPTEEMLTSAVGRFKTSFMALSFFDANYEIIKVENGYNAKFIPRDISLAAHAMLSKEVFTILDTKEV